jgi:hypothetical protein
MSEFPALAMSEESEIDREVTRLIAKMVAGEATEADKRKYNDLSRRRAALMQPALFPRNERRGDERRGAKVA